LREVLGALRETHTLDESVTAAASGVRRWSWRPAPSGVEYEELWWAEREGLIVGAESVGEPPANQAVDVIGRDEDGALVYAELHDRRGAANGFMSRSERGGVSTMLVLGDGREKIGRAWRREGRLIQVARAWQRGVGQIGLAVERYGYESGGRISVERDHGVLAGTEWEMRSRRRFVVDLDLEGRALTIEVPDEQLVLYRRPTLSRAALERRLDAFAGRLAEEVLALARRCPPPDEAYALMLAYEDGDEPERALLTEPLWGLQRYRQSLADDPERATTAWDPASYWSFSDDPDWEPFDELREEAAILGREIEARRAYAKGRETLVRATAILNRRDWRGWSTTSDFVVLAGEHQMVDARDNLRDAATSPQWERLEQRGWT
jgi:hypothetical protein